MHNTSRLVLPFLACTLLGGCAGGSAGGSATRIVGDTAGTAGGALLGHKLSKGNSAYTALGAGGGVVLSESLQAGSRGSAQKSYAAGY